MRCLPFTRISPYPAHCCSCLRALRAATPPAVSSGRLVSSPAPPKTMSARCEAQQRSPTPNDRALHHPRQPTNWTSMLSPLGSRGRSSFSRIQRPALHTQPLVLPIIATSQGWFWTHAGNMQSSLRKHALPDRMQLIVRTAEEQVDELSVAGPHQVLVCRWSSVPACRPRLYLGTSKRAVTRSCEVQMNAAGKGASNPGDEGLSGGCTHTASSISPSKTSSLVAASTQHPAILFFSQA